MSEFDPTTSQNKRGILPLMRILLAIFIGVIAISQLFIVYRGLANDAAMDQAQIARQIARGEGFTTKFLRPRNITDHVKALREKAPYEEISVDFDHFRDTNQSMVYPYVLATALKVTGYDKFDEKRMDTGLSNIYGGDRVVSGVSMIFYLISLVLTYTLIRRLFDDVVAGSTVLLMGVSSPLLAYATSGLPQPFLTCIVLTIGHILISLIRADDQEQRKRSIILSCVVYLLLVILCLTNAMCISTTIGFIVFAAIFFQPRGLHAAIGAAFMIFLVLIPGIISMADYGGVLRHLTYGVFGGFGASEANTLLRTTSESALVFNTGNFFLRLLGYTFSQVNSMYENMGGIVTVPFFLLSLFTRFRRREVEGIKWAVFSMWVGSCAAMALFGEDKIVSVSQISTLFTPFFAAYGLTQVFNYLSRMQLGTAYESVRNLAIAVIVFVSAGMFLFQLPRELYMGVWSSAKGIPNFPPYYPPVLNGKLHDITNPNDIIVTDQPWAVAWYADRKALWMPMSINDYVNDLENTFKMSRQGVQGFLITPTSHTMPKGGVTGIIRQMGDFTPLALEGKLLILAPKHNMAFAELFTTQAMGNESTRALGNIVSSQGQFPNRNFLLGGEIIYYSRDNVEEQAN
ncbi:MAG: hypothetical protein IKK45_04340 [Akkermansia sp.]|nr:hypothetical protein [Akkermansia sp.]